MKVKLVEIQGDQPDYSDLLGQTGILVLAVQEPYFRADNGEWLTMSVERLTRKNDKVKISTHLGNTFTFQTVWPCADR